VSETWKLEAWFDRAQNGVTVEVDGLPLSVHAVEVRQVEQPSRINMEMRADLLPRTTEIVLILRPIEHDRGDGPEALWTIRTEAGCAS
jgi:hypothetical protein